MSPTSEPPSRAYFVRDYRPEDYPSLLSLWQSEGRNPFTVEHIERLLASGGGALVAETQAVEEDAAGEVIGCLLWSHNGRGAFLWRLAVAPAYRRRGVASSLLQRAEQEIWQAGFRRLGLLVHSSNEAAKSLYARLGWTYGDGMETWWRTLGTPSEAGSGLEPASAGCMVQDGISNPFADRILTEDPAE